MARELSSLEVVVLDCQATGPRGRLLELGWARVAPPLPTSPVARLIALPEGERLPRRVAKITGLSDRALRDGSTPIAVYRELLATLGGRREGVPAVIHFASFEAPFLADLAREEGAPSPFEIVCAHAIARRLLPDLPRRTLRALAGYFGLALAAPRRSADHVEATAFVWRGLVALLAERAGVTTWEALGDYLRTSAKKASRRAYPMPAAVRLAAPDGPGIYRMLRVDGSVLYVGKATSLSARVNSYFRRQSGGPERTLEMLSQARDLSMTTTESALEAALAEADEIKRLRPPYNVALTTEGRSLWFASSDLASIARAPDERHCRGPLSSPLAVSSLAALASALDGRGPLDPTAILGIPERYAPSSERLRQGISRFVEEHGEVVSGGLGALLRLGSSLWGEDLSQATSEDPLPADLPREPTPADIALALARLVATAAHALRRGRFLTRLVDSTVVWREATSVGTRMLVIARGEVIGREAVPEASAAPPPPGGDRPWAERRAAMDIGAFDRLRVLTTELRRVIAEGSPAELRFDPRRALSGDGLRRALSRV